MCILLNSSTTDSVVVLSVLTRRNLGFGLTVMNSKGMSKFTED